MRTIDPKRIEIVDEAMARVLRAKTVTERVAMIAGADRFMRERLSAYLKWRHADWDRAAVRREVARRMSHGPA